MACCLLRILPTTLPIASTNQLYNYILLIIVNVSYFMCPHDCECACTASYQNFAWIYILHLGTYRQTSPSSGSRALARPLKACTPNTTPNAKSAHERKLLSRPGTFKLSRAIYWRPAPDERLEAFKTESRRLCIFFSSAVKDFASWPPHKVNSNNPL